jgi:hypothetical protein
MGRALVILRHEKSLAIVRAWLQDHDIDAVCVALDPVELPDDTEAALKQIRQSIENGVAVIILGTKVYDHTKKEQTDPPEQLIEFLEILKSYSCGTTPLCLTHLADMPPALVAETRAMGLNVRFVENDNLGRDGMHNLGPVILKALDNAA